MFIQSNDLRPTVLVNSYFPFHSHREKMGTFLGQHTHTFWYCAPKTASVMAVGRGEQRSKLFCSWLSHYEPVYALKKAISEGQWRETYINMVYLSVEN